MLGSKYCLMSATSTPLLELPSDLDRDRLPQHVAVIMDGNGRWAQKRHLPRIMGHHRGADALHELAMCFTDWGIESLTVYAFSTENWRRPEREVNFLMLLIEHILRREVRFMQEREVRFRVLGDMTLLPDSLRRQAEKVMAQTAHYRQHNMNMAVNYGGRQEIARACQTLAERVKSGELRPEEINEQSLEQYLYTAEQRDPDLLIRTSGEMRVSNFLLWQLAYSEFYVTDTLWPDFSRQDFYEALMEYQQRDRRYGKVSAPAV